MKLSELIPFPCVKCGEAMNHSAVAFIDGIGALCPTHWWEWRDGKLDSSRVTDPIQVPPCSTPLPSTDALLRARYHFPAEPMKNLSIGDLTDLLIAYAAEEISEGCLVDMTGLGRDTIRGLRQDAITRSDRLWRSWREEEESGFQASLASSKSAPSGCGSSSTTEKPC